MDLVNSRDFCEFVEDDWISVCFLMSVFTRTTGIGGACRVLGMGFRRLCGTGGETGCVSVRGFVIGLGGSSLFTLFSLSPIGLLLMVVGVLVICMGLVKGPIICCSS